MTIPDRPDNGQDEGRKPDGSWIRDELRRAKQRSDQVPTWARPVITRPVSTRRPIPPAVADEQRRELVEDWLWRRESQQLDLPDTAPHRAAFIAGSQPDITELLVLLGQDGNGKVGE